MLYCRYLCNTKKYSEEGYQIVDVDHAEQSVHARKPVRLNDRDLPLQYRMQLLDPLWERTPLNCT